MKYMVLCGAAVFLLLNILPVPHRITNPVVDKSLSIGADPDVPRPVLKILARSCMDCHSNNTRVPWYGRVAPASWLMARDVAQARQAMNLSAWGTSKHAVQVALAAAACEDVKGGRMPKPQYLLLHPEAKLSQADVEVICGWQKTAVAAMIRKHRKAQPEVSE